MGRAVVDLVVRAARAEGMEVSREEEDTVSKVVEEDTVVREDNRVDTAKAPVPPTAPALSTVAPPPTSPPRTTTPRNTTAVPPTTNRFSKTQPPV